MINNGNFINNKEVIYLYGKGHFKQLVRERENKRGVKYARIEWTNVQSILLNQFREK